MSEEERILYLNNRIVELNKKIKIANTRDEIIGIISELFIFSGINIWYIWNLSESVDDVLYSIVLLGSIGLGMIPGINLPTYRTMKKISSYQLEIKRNMNELHQYALEEDKRITKIKKCQDRRY